MYTKKWIVTKTDEEKIKSLSAELKIPNLVAKVLASRGIFEKKDAERYLSCEPSVLYDPFLLKDMDKAVARIQKAIDNKEKVSINEKENAKFIVYEVKVAKEDMGKVIGKQGKMAKAIRTVMKSIATKENKKINIEFLD